MGPRHNRTQQKNMSTLDRKIKAFKNNKKSLEVWNHFTEKIEYYGMASCAVLGTVLYVNGFNRVPQDESIQMHKPILFIFLGFVVMALLRIVFRKKVLYNNKNKTESSKSFKNLSDAQRKKVNGKSNSNIKSYLQKAQDFALKLCHLKKEQNLSVRQRFENSQSLRGQNGRNPKSHKIAYAGQNVTKPTEPNESNTTVSNAKTEKEKRQRRAKIQSNIVYGAVFVTFSVYLFSRCSQ